MSRTRPCAARLTFFGAANETSSRRPRGGQLTFGAWRLPGSQGTAASGARVECDTYVKARLSATTDAGRRR